MNRIMLLIVGALMLPVVAQAEIYESTDAEGNPVFSDQPQSGAEEITLPKANVADPLPPASETGSAVDVEEKAAKPNIVVAPNAHNEEVESEFMSGSRHDVREAQERHEVLEAEKRHEVR